MSYKILLTLFLLFLKLFTQTLDYSKIPIFQPLPTAVINPLQGCQAGQSSKILNFSLFSHNYLAVTLDECGIRIYDITNLNTILLVFSDTLASNGKALGVSTSHSQKYLWVGHSTGSYFLFDISELPFTKILTGTSTNNQLINLVIPYRLNNDLLFFLCSNEIQIYNFNEKNLQLTLTREIPINAVVAFQIDFMMNYKYALVAASTQGVQFYSVQNSNDITQFNLQYLCVINPSSFNTVGFNLIDNSYLIVTCRYSGVYLYNMDQFFQQNGSVCNANSFVKVIKSITFGFTGTSILSQNKRYLYTQQRIIGVRLFDISSKTFQTLQTVQVSENSQDLVLSSDENTIYYSNSLTISIFQKTKPNLNRDIPNLLLNNYQISTYPSIKATSLGSIDYQCVWQQNKQLLFLTQSNYGVSILNYQQNGILTQSSGVYRQFSNSQTSTIEFFSDQTHAFVSRSNLGISIVSFNNPASPVIIQENITLNQNYVNFSYLKFFKNYQLTLICNDMSGLIVSTQNPFNPVLISTIDISSHTLGEATFSRFILSADENTAFFVVSTFGILVVDLTNVESPQILSSLYIGETYDVQLFRNGQYLAIAASYQGLIITSISNGFSLNITSTIKTIGVCYRLLIFSSENYLFATSQEVASVSLVNISDVNNCFVQQQIVDPSAFGFYSMCLSSDSSQVFITNFMSLFLLQLQIQALIHTQTYQIQNSQSGNSNTIKVVNDNNIPFQVGETIEIILVPIYQTNQVMIQQVFYNSNFQLIDLPQWMTFLKNDNTLQINIQKECLQQNSQGQYIETLQQVTFLIFQQVTNNIFINQFLNISPSDSISLFNACTNEGYLDEYGFLDLNYSPSNPIYFGSNESVYLSKWDISQHNLIKSFIQFQLNLNIINYNTQFSVTQSLSFDPTNSSVYITSLQNQVSIVLTIQAADATISSSRFVLFNDMSLQVLFSEKNNELTITGDLDSVNNILANGLRVYQEEKVWERGMTKIHITLTDSVNYPYMNTFDITELNFIVKYKTISQKLSLQSEINSIFSNAQIYITQNFYYQISDRDFMYNSKDTLSFNALYRSGSHSYTEIPKNYWLQFSSTERVFTGIPPANMLLKSVQIQVNVTDGYSFIVDTFEIHLDLIPFSYFMEIFIQCLGVFIGLVGFYQKKHIFYNILFKKSFTYSKETTRVGETYVKQIVISENAGELARILWQHFLKNIDQVQFRLQIFLEINRANQMTNYSYLGEQTLHPQQHQTSYKNIDQTKQSPFSKYIENSKQPNISFSQTFQLNESAVKNIDIQIHENDLQKSVLQQSKSIVKEIQYPATQKISSILNSNISQLNRISTTTSNSHSSTSKLSIQQVLIIKQIISQIKVYEKEFKNTNTIPQEKKENQLQQDDSLNLFEDSGEINFKGILQKVKIQQKQLPKKKRILNKQGLKLLDNENSVLSKAFYCYLIEYIVKEEGITRLLFSWTKAAALKKNNIVIDWYKYYLDVEPKLDDIQNSPYPSMIINDQTLKIVLKDLFKIIGKYYCNNTNKTPKSFKFSLYLLEESIKIQAYGFSLQRKNLLSFSRGESIQASSDQIHTVTAFERRKSSCFGFILKAFGIDYQKKSIRDNLKLPSWIKKVDLINSVLMLQGIPQEKDIGVIQLKVYNEAEFILCKFELEVLPPTSIENHPIQMNSNQNLLIENNQNKKPNVQFFKSFYSKLQKGPRNYVESEKFILSSKNNEQHSQQTEDNQIISIIDSSFQTDSIAEVVSEQTVFDEQCQSKIQQMGEIKKQISNQLSIIDRIQQQQQQTLAPH